MAQIAFILLCHKDPEGIIAQARRLTAAGDYLAIHFDGNASSDDYARLREALDGNPSVTFARRRAKCGWGEWSLVQATLNAVEAAVAAFPRASHFYMLSGDCMPIKSARYVREFLDADDVDYIESFDFFKSDWIKTGIKRERLIYRHYFNERKNKWLFYASMNLQQRLGLERDIPADIEVMIGSQWWCLRRQTIEAILTFIRSRRDVMRFFRTTWIPDETFFQTLVRHLVPDREIRTRTLTFLLFSDYGMPAVFYDDQFDLLISQNYLFARKISPDAKRLKAQLAELYVTPDAQFQISDEGRNLYRFLTGRGRVGRRFAPRFWESEASLGRERELMVIVCKKWHVAKRLTERIRQMTDVPALDYLFNEDAAELPDLGGIQTTLSKRTRHRRALMRMLFDYHGTNRMVICIDPANIELLHDFCSDRCTTRIIEIQCSFSDDYLAGHAQRVGLAGPATPPETLARLLPTIRFDMRFESEQIRDADFPNLTRLREDGPPEENATALGRFLDMPADQAQTLLQIDYLFTD
ncbi:DUF5928 domain-containing protein [Plastorhodobacter daqingensis]|uniref:Peptide O-xylosyltransferase n=1 Tax=Plastorhodobacter daqingensis TaxID=1387281 RepID=A0ABW2UEF1_9RHOB